MIPRNRKNNHLGCLEWISGIFGSRGDFQELGSLRNKTDVTNGQKYKISIINPLLYKYGVYDTSKNDFLEIIL